MPCVFSSAARKRRASSVPQRSGMKKQGAEKSQQLQQPSQREHIAFLPSCNRQHRLQRENKAWDSKDREWNVLVLLGMKITNGRAVMCTCRHCSQGKLRHGQYGHWMTKATVSGRSPL